MMVELSIFASHLKSRWTGEKINHTSFNRQFLPQIILTDAHVQQPLIPSFDYLTTADLEWEWLITVKATNKREEKRSLGSAIEMAGVIYDYTGGRTLDTGHESNAHHCVLNNFHNYIEFMSFLVSTKIHKTGNCYRRFCVRVFAVRIFSHGNVYARVSETPWNLSVCGWLHELCYRNLQQNVLFTPFLKQRRGCNCDLLVPYFILFFDLFLVRNQFLFTFNYENERTLNNNNYKI